MDAKARASAQRRTAQAGRVQELYAPEEQKELRGPVINQTRCTPGCWDSIPQPRAVGPGRQRPGALRAGLQPEW
jgi:hypothetical protein